jgi:hypothetical protein
MVAHVSIAYTVSTLVMSSLTASRETVTEYNHQINTGAADAVLI